MKLGTKVAKEIVKVASSYIGEEEVSGNSGFKNPVLEKQMREIGWQTGHAWCAYFAELVWKEAFSSFDEFSEISMRSLFRRLFSANSLRTFDNFKNTGWGIDSEPTIGAMAIWKRPHGGHIDIVTHVGKKDFLVVGGNLSDKVSTPKRTLPTSGDLTIVGFIPVESEQWRRFTTSK